MTGLTPVAAKLSKKVKVAIKWSFDLLFPLDIEQLVTLRDVEGIAKLGATLRTMRAAAEVPPGDPRSGEAPRLRT